LRVRKVLVDKDTFDKLGVCERTSNFAFDFDEIEGDVLSL